MSNDRDDDQDDGTDLVPRSHIRGLEEKAARVSELEAQVEKLTKDSVFNTALAGIDHPGLSYFKDGYKGDLTPEAIRQAAIEAGFGHAEPETDAPPAKPGTPTPPDLAAHQRMAAAAVGAAPPPPFDPIAAIANAQSVDEVMEIVEAHGEKYGVISSRLAQ